MLTKKQIKDLEKTIKNLRILATFIKENVKPKQIEMESFRSHVDEDGDRCQSEFISKNDCGTSGCAMGWGPFSEDLKSKKSDFSDDYIWKDDSYVRVKTLDFDKYGPRLWPAFYEKIIDDLDDSITYDLDENWGKVFGSDLSSKKPKVVARLFNMAKKLERGLDRLVNNE